MLNSLVKGLAIMLGYIIFFLFLGDDIFSILTDNTVDKIKLGFSASVILAYFATVLNGVYYELIKLNKSDKDDK